MKNIACLILVAFLASCGEYIPQTVFEIETTSGKIVKFSCPVVQQGRSTFTYLIDHECRLISN